MPKKTKPYAVFLLYWFDGGVLEYCAI